MQKKPRRRKPSAALEAYREKRNFSHTPEPSDDASKSKTDQPTVFVVQEHHARSHHFDLRIEMDGVLASWAVPKGISLDPGVNRLAIHVEDHPLEYATFEGVIPKGNYGAGNVSIWDKGHWVPLDKNWRSSYKKGKLKIALEGTKLRGSYLLARIKDEENWILRKLPHQHEPDPTARPQKEVADFVIPQLARVVSTVPSGSDWIHEIKFDGYRLIAVRKDGRVRLHTRTGLDWTDRFPVLSDDLSGLASGDFVMDGEVVVFDTDGRSRFGLLQKELKSSTGRRMKFVAFDILNHKGASLRSLPLSERLQHLEKILPDDTPHIVRSKIWPGNNGPKLFKEACRLGLEGIISKKRAGSYHSGDRRDWVKSKCRARQEFVICGFTRPNGSCPGFGALVLGSFENGRLVPRGKVGTGFTDASRGALLKTMKPLKVSTAPFDFPDRGVTWIDPRLVAEVEFAELTDDCAIRQGSFISLRDDKPSQTVHLDPIHKSRTVEGPAIVMKTTITHPDREVFPGEGITKLQVAEWFERHGARMLPYLKNRPLAILRAPDGIGGEMFFQKSFKTHVPDEVQTRKLGDKTQVISVKNVEGIVSLAQFGMIEIHPWGSTLEKPDKPDQIIWDLDPDSSIQWKEVLGAAFLLRDFLVDRGLKSVVKTSGGKGLHVVLPIRRDHGWEVIKPFSKAVASAVASFNPKRFIVESAIAKRKGRIYIDWLRNGRGATCIAPWCLRARPTAPISMPVDWKELAEVPPHGFNIHDPLPPMLEWEKIRPQRINNGHISEFLPKIKF